MSTVILPEAPVSRFGYFTDVSNLQEIFDRIQQKLAETGLAADAASGLADRPDAIRNLKRALKANRRGISTDTLIALAPVLKTSASWLLEGGPEDRPNAIDEDRLEDVLAELLHLAGRKDPRPVARTTIEQLKAPPLSEDEKNAQALFLLRWKQSLEKADKPRRGKRPEPP